MIQSPFGAEAFKVCLSKSATIQSLKETIAFKLNLLIDKFYLVRSANDKDIKEMNRTIEQLGFQYNAVINVKLGQPKLEGCYEISLYQIALQDEGNDSDLFSKRFICNMLVSVHQSGSDLYQMCTDKCDGPFWLRNPNYDIG